MSQPSRDMYTCYKCVIDCHFGQYRTQYTTSRLRRSGVYKTVLPSPQSIANKYIPDGTAVRACIEYGIAPLVLSITFITRTAGLPILFVVLGVKVRSITCSIGPTELAISGNMDRSRMLGVGRLHNDSHVPCNYNR